VGPDPRAWGLVIGIRCAAWENNRVDLHHRGSCSARLLLRRGSPWVFFPGRFHDGRANRRAMLGASRHGDAIFSSSLKSSGGLVTPRACCLRTVISAPHPRGDRGATAARASCSASGRHARAPSNSHPRKRHCLPLLQFLDFHGPSTSRPWRGLLLATLLLTSHRAGGIDVPVAGLGAILPALNDLRNMWSDCVERCGPTPS